MYVAQNANRRLLFDLAFTELIWCRSGATAFRQWGQDFLFISFTACSPNLSGGNNIVLPPQPHLSGGKLPPLPYGDVAHDLMCSSRYLGGIKHFHQETIQYIESIKNLRQRPKPLTCRRSERRRHHQRRRRRRRRNLESHWIHVSSRAARDNRPCAGGGRTSTARPPPSRPRPPTPTSSDERRPTTTTGADGRRLE